MREHRGSREVTLIGRIMRTDQFQITPVERMEALGLLKNSNAPTLNGSVP